MMLLTQKDLFFDNKLEELLEDYSDPIEENAGIVFTDDFTLQDIKEKNYLSTNGKLRVNLIINDLRKTIAFIQTTDSYFLVKELAPTNIFYRYQLAEIKYPRAKSYLNTFSFNNIFQKPKTIWTILKEGRNMDYIAYAQKCFFTQNHHFFSFYRGFEIKQLLFNEYDEKIVHIFLSHIYKIICNKNQVCYDYVINWICFLLQNPTEKLGTALVLIGPHGAGKNMFANVICQLLGSYAIPNAKFENYTGNFNINLQDKRLIVINEKTSYKENVHYDSDVLKSLITESTIDYHGKYQNVFHDENVANFMIVSNNPVPIKIEKGDRRFVVIQASGKYADDGIYFDKLLKSFTPLFYQHLLTFFCHNNIDDWDRRKIPWTSAKKTIISFCHHSFSEFIRKHKDDFRKGIPRSTAYGLYTQWCEENEETKLNVQKFKWEIIKHCDERRPRTNNPERQIFYQLKDDYKDIPLSDDE